MSKAKRLRTVGEEFNRAIASKSLPTEQKSLTQLEDAALFKVDAVGGTAVHSETPNEVKAKSKRARPLQHSTLKKIDELAAKAKSQKLNSKVKSEDIINDYTNPELRDFWAAGEGGLPPAKQLAIKDLRGRNPGETLNEWNIHTVPMMSAKRTQKIHEKNRRQKVTPLIPLSGISYNPAAEDHADALVTLARTQEVATADQRKRKAYTEKIKALQEKTRLEQNTLTDTLVESDDDNDDAEDEVLHFPQSSERKTKAQRNKEKKQRAVELERSVVKKERKLLADLSKIKKIAKELEEQNREREERRKAREQNALVKPEKPFVSINGRKTPIAKMLGRNPLPAVLAPGQLPDTMRGIPGVGGLLEEEYVKLRAENAVETGRPTARGRRDAKWKKVRKVEKFDIDAVAQRTAKPRFKVPAKLLGSATAPTSAKGTVTKTK